MPTVPVGGKTRLYKAENGDGLSTECRSSISAVLIDDTTTLRNGVPGGETLCQSKQGQYWLVLDQAPECVISLHTPGMGCAMGGNDDL